jgi:hypothetical protein
MRDDHRQCILLLRADVNKVDVEPVDLGDELRQGVEAGFDLSPVIVSLPVAHEVLQHRERYALRVVGDRFLLRPPRCRQTLLKVDEISLGNIDAERTDRFVGRRLCGSDRK